MPALLTYKTTQYDEGKTVADILKRQFDMSSSVLKNLKQNKRIFLNDLPCRTIDTVKTNDFVCADVTEYSETESNIIPYKDDLNIIYEDDFLLVVNKPGNMEAHPCPSNRISSLANIIMYYWLKKGEKHSYHIVNRLDKGTSGICVVAKNPFTHANLAKQAKNGIFKKFYVAIVHGVIPQKKDSIDLPITRSEESIIKRIVSPSGKPARTFYEVIFENEKYSLLKILLDTGRTHQIRVHFSYIGHPLVGDWLYGNGDNERDIINRQALHAKTIEFFHPATKEKLLFDTDIPKEMEKLLI